MSEQKLPIEKVDKIVREAKRYARMMHIDFDEQRFRRDHQRYHVIEDIDITTHGDDHIKKVRIR